MSELHFRDTFRTAALHLLEQTPLGEAVRLFGTVTDEDGLLTVEALPIGMSSGEKLLFALLMSLAGQGLIGLRAVLEGLDDDCRFAAWWAIGLAAGHVADFAPVRFRA